jgi:hypothetical protein
MATITNEEKEQVQKLQEKYSELTVKLGQITMEVSDLETMLTNLNDLKNTLLVEYTNARNSEKAFIDSLSDKYGNGNLNLETGEFLPVE